MIDVVEQVVERHPKLKMRGSLRGGTAPYPWIKA
jgi:hypothetical protein